MKKELAFIACLVLLSATLFGFGSRVGLALQAAIRGGSFLAAAPASSGGAAGADLTASLGDLLRTNADAVAGTSSGRTVPVYSQYPFNLKNELSIAAGSADGIAEGDAAVSGGYLVGVVLKTFDRSALVETVFDSRFQMPVRIGKTGADALLRGGASPSLTLIAASAAVNEGDEVYAAASGMPYGIPIGELRGLHDASDKVFREASLAVPSDPGDLQEVTILPSSAK